MVDLPWGGDDEDAGGDGAGDPDHEDAIAVCECQDGTVSVTETAVRIDRPGRSRFAGKTIPLSEVTGVEYSGGLAIGWIQIRQTGHEPATGGLISSPVGENTLHFGRGARDRATRVRDAILERATGQAPSET